MNQIHKNSKENRKSSMLIVAQSINFKINDNDKKFNLNIKVFFILVRYFSCS